MKRYCRVVLFFLGAFLLFGGIAFGQGQANPTSSEVKSTPSEIKSSPVEIKINPSEIKVNPSQIQIQVSPSEIKLSPSEVKLIQDGSTKDEKPWKDLLTVPPDELKTHVLKILRTTNKAQVNRYVGKVYDFKKVNPGQINNYFNSALFKEEGASYVFMNPDGKSGKIFVICPEYQIPYYDQLAVELDRTDLTSAPGSAYIYRKLKHRGVHAFLPADDQYLRIVEQYVTANGVLRGDVETNAVFAFDSPSAGDYFNKYMDEYLDTPTPVVNIKVKIFEVNVNNDGTLGLDYEDYKNGPYQNMLVGVINYNTLDASGYIHEEGASRQSGDVHGRQYDRYGLVNFQYPSSYFDFLVEKGKARIVTEIKLLSSAGREALLHTGEQILYYRKTNYTESWYRTVEGTTKNRQVLPTGTKTIKEPDLDDPNKSTTVAAVSVGASPKQFDVEALDTGIRLMVRPIIGEQNIDMRVEADVISLLGFTDSGDPLIDSRKANTRLSVKDGQEFILGGLVRDRQGRTSYKVPILGKLPVLGWLFGGETEISQKSMLVMVIQPEIDKTFDKSIEMKATEADKAIMDVVSGTVQPTIPASSYGFDMYLLDSEK